MDIEKERGFSIDYLNECFDLIDGVLIWKERPVGHFHSERYWKVFMARFSGKPAGKINQGYLITKVGGKYLLNHRVIYLLSNKKTGPVIDHIDGNTLNNKPENLRLCTLSGNMQNCKTNIVNTSGRKGVYFHNGIGKWTASIRINKKLTHLGCFDSFESAVDARKKAEVEHYREFANER